MKLDTRGMTGEQAWELSKWCGETAEALRERCRDSDRAARAWWDDECDKPEELDSSPGRGEDMLSFADRLQAEGFDWAGEAGGLFAAEDLAKARTMKVDRFVPADELDGPAEGEDLTTPSPAVALRFVFDRDLVEFLKGILVRVRRARGGRGRPLSKIPFAGGWSTASGCWWVRSTYWAEVRKALIGEGVSLTGPLAGPRTVREGFFERKQVWDVKACVWR